MTTLYLCEKPSQGRDIAKVLGVTQRHDGYLAGNDLLVSWCVGHLLELAPPESYCKNLKPWRMAILPVIPPTWTVQPNPKTQKQLQVLQTLLKKVDHVVIATDADREGDVIGREVLAYCQFEGTVERLWLAALDDASIRKALANLRPGQSTIPLYQAGLGRQRADWLIGMNMTMATSALFSAPGQGALSVGRVQTPTLNLVVERDLLIEQFQTTNYFVLAIQCQVDQESFWAKWEPGEDQTDLDGRCVKRELIDAVATKLVNQQACVVSFEEKAKKTPPPVCYSLSSLQKVCSSQLGLTAKNTLKVAQALYEQHKAITYPRTDTGYLPENQFCEAKAVLDALAAIDPDLQPLVEQADPTWRSPAWNDKKVTAHHGLMPTANHNVSLSRLSEDERAVYDLIRRAYLAQFLGVYEYLQRQVTLSAVEETFKASCQLPQRHGWKAVRSIEEPDSEEKKQQVIPLLTHDALLPINNTQVLPKKTQPPARFTEGTLIAAMKNIAKIVDEQALKKTLRETAGIGTEATRADIIEKLVYREYVVRKQKQLVSTEKGRRLISILPEAIKNPATTAQWEKVLDDIAQGKAELDTFLLDQIECLDFLLEDLATIRHQRGQGLVASETYPCPQCQAPLARRRGKHGYFWGCTRYPECEALLQDHDGKPQGCCLYIM